MMVRTVPRIPVVISTSENSTMMWAPLSQVPQPLLLIESAGEPGHSAGSLSKIIKIFSSE